MIAPVNRSEAVRTRQQEGQLFAGEIMFCF